LGTKVSGFSQEEFRTLHLLTFNNASADRAYYQQGITQSAKDMVLPGEVNQAKNLWSISIW
jgi:hypothetical protein